MYIKQINVWLAVTPDKYELPIAVAESAGELAEHMGTTAQAIRNRMSQEKHMGRVSTDYWVRKVRVHDDTKNRRIDGH